MKKKIIVMQALPFCPLMIINTPLLNLQSCDTYILKNYYLILSIVLALLNASAFIMI